MSAFPQPSEGPSSASDAMFGARLRMERERRRITLASIAANTKIGRHLLEGLERGQVTRWPSGIFRRSFIRAYAQAVGLDPDEIAREFLARFPDPADLPFEFPTPGVRRTPGNEAVLRLHLADLESASACGTLLFGMGPRWAAAAWDVSILMAIGLLFFAALGQFWMPLAIATLVYYAAGILLLGNTPGVSLFASVPGERRAGQPDHARASLFKTCAAIFRQAAGRRGEAVNR
jgi:transcriptional regulator with XRE-family HTH domain